MDLRYGPFFYNMLGVFVSKFLVEREGLVPSLVRCPTYLVLIVSPGRGRSAS
jgi:hypothetical protein